MKDKTGHHGEKHTTPWYGNEHPSKPGSDVIPFLKWLSPTSSQVGPHLQNPEISLLGLQVGSAQYWCSPLLCQCRQKLIISCHLATVYHSEPIPIPSATAALPLSLGLADFRPTSQLAHLLQSDLLVTGLFLSFMCWLKYHLLREDFADSQSKVASSSLIYFLSYIIF